MQDGGRRVTGHRRWNRDHSLLVEIFLDEQETEEAWQEAQAGGCRNDLWLRLAAKREIEHPEDAVSVYLRLGEQAIVHTQGAIMSLRFSCWKRPRRCCIRRGEARSSNNCSRLCARNIRPNGTCKSWPKRGVSSYICARHALSHFFCCYILSEGGQGPFLCCDRAEKYTPRSQKRDLGHPRITRSRYGEGKRHVWQR